MSSKKGSANVNMRPGFNTSPAKVSMKPGGSTSSAHTSRRPDRSLNVHARPGSGVSSNTRPDSGVSSNTRPGSGVSSNHGNTRHGSSGSSSLQEIDLNVSKGSQASGHSFVQLGGVDYPIGSRIGTSGMFVIGDPGVSRHNTTSSTMPSVASSQMPIYRGDGKGYSFEYWPWSIIRFVCFVFLCLIMVGLLAGTITVAIQHKKGCETNFQWWQGSTFYTVPLPFFHDTDANNVGDIIGIEKRDTYFEHIGSEAIILKNILWSEQDDWELLQSFTEVDHRLGSTNDLIQTISALHDSNIHVILHMCPWFTSKEHPWFIESRGSSVLSINTYGEFYIWKDEPGLTGKWQFDETRSQYYMYKDDKNKPVLDWKNYKVRDTFVGILELWLQRGIDGFVLCDLTKFEIASEVTVYDFLGRFHESVSSFSKGQESQRILIIESDYVKRVETTYSNLLEDILGVVDMIQMPLTLYTENKTQGLQGQVENGLVYRTGPERPWINWDLTNLTTVTPQNVGALELLNVMLPGTPGYTAGQEVGVFYLENDDWYQAPLVWLPGTGLPLNSGGLGTEQIDALRNVSQQRKKSYSLRSDFLPEKDNEMNYNFLEVDSEKDFILFSRYYPLDNTFYYAANFGDKELKKDFREMIAPFATVLADTAGKLHGRLELEEVVLQPGQAIVLYPTK